METAAFILISILIGTEVYCFTAICDYFKQKSADKTDERREKYRRKAYQEKDESYRIAQNKEILWRMIEK